MPQPVAERPGDAPRAILLDLLMATMDSMSAWAVAAGDQARGLAWRDAVTRRMVTIGRYVAYERLVVDAAAELELAADAPRRLWSAWRTMRPWPDAASLRGLDRPFGFVTNCSTALATAAVERSGLSPVMTVTAEDVGWFKPRAEVYRLACERIGAEPADVRFLAGAAYDASGAAEAGLDAWLIARRASTQAVAPSVRLVSTLDEAIPVG